MASTGPHPPPITPGRRSLTRGAASLGLGWSLVAVGIVLLPLPGPGTLVVVAGLRVLVPHHRWAAVAYDRLRGRAVAAAAAGVATWSRVLVSTLGVWWLVAMTTLYGLDPQFSPVEVLGRTVGPGLPFHSLATVLGLAGSAVASAGLLALTVARWGPHRTSGTPYGGAPGTPAPTGPAPRTTRCRRTSGSGIRTNRRRPCVRR